jgi:hypothetical protein
VKRALRLVLGFAGAAASLALGACTSETGDGGEGGSGGGTSHATTASTATGPVGCGLFAEALTDAECASCAEASCCAELLECDTGTDCEALISCEIACSDDTCMSQCQADHAGGIGARDALDACLGGPCGSDCATAAAGICGSELTTDDPVCDSCLEAGCCAEVDACVDDVNCAACAVGDPSGSECDLDPLFAEMRACFSSCNTDCDG